MSTTMTVTDYVMWTKHVHGDDALAARLAALRPGSVVTLRVAGHVGPWRKMDDGKDGRPTPGLKPIGCAQEQWKRLYTSRRGDIVDLELVQDAPERSSIEVEDSMVYAAEKLVRADSDRKAALNAFLAVASQGWASDDAYGSRDELHER